MKMLQRAAELRPDDGAITNSVGWAFYRLGQYDKAVEWLPRRRAEGRRRHHHRASRHAYCTSRKREARFHGSRLSAEAGQDRLPVIRDKLDNGLSAANDKPTVYEKPPKPSRAAEAP